MATHSSSHPLHAMELPWPSVIGAAAGHLKLVAFIAGCLVLSAGARLAGSTGAASRAPIAAAVFFAQATGTVVQPTAVADAPAGTAGRWLGRGEIVSVGGRFADVGGAAGVYWVEVITPAGGRDYGFVPTSALAITAGRVPDLRYDAAAPAAWLDPAEPSSAVPDGASGVASAGDAAGAVAGVSIGWLPASVQAHADRIATAAARHGVDPDLVAILVLVESGGNPHAASPAGASGLMQLMPGTAAEMARASGQSAFDPASLADPDVNVDLGAAYLSAMLKAFGQPDDTDWQQSVELAAAAYNGGPGHVGQHLTTGQPLFAETASYQRWVGGMWRERRSPDSPTYRAWLAAGGQRLVDTAQGAVAMAQPTLP